jgi:prolyl 4-hydroxylase
MTMVEPLITAEVLPALREWFELNFSTGSTLEQLKDTLLEVGYREGDIDGFLTGELSRRAAHPPHALFDADPVRSADEAVDRFWRRVDVLCSFNRISLADRTVHLAAKHAGCAIFYIPDFLSAEECDSLIADAHGSLSESMVLDESEGVHVRAGSRSSHGARIGRGATERVRRIESRLAKLTDLPTSHGEDLQLLHYEVGGEYRPHFDYFDPETPGGARELSLGSQRLATLIMYLCDVEGGGATFFPELSLAFTPTRGAALLFASLARTGAPLQTSLHCGCPVTSGEKWIATKWIRALPAPSR